MYAETGDQLKSDAIFWSMMFLVLGAVQGVGFFVAVGCCICARVHAAAVDCRRTCSAGLVNG